MLGKWCLKSPFFFKHVTRIEGFSQKLFQIGIIFEIAECAVSCSTQHGRADPNTTQTLPGLACTETCSTLCYPRQRVSESLLQRPLFGAVRETTIRRFQLHVKRTYSCCRILVLVDSIQQETRTTQHQASCKNVFVSRTRQERFLVSALAERVLQWPIRSHFRRFQPKLKNNSNLEQFL